MPVSKNNRKNQKKVNDRNSKRVIAAKKANSGYAVLGRGLAQFNEIRNNVRRLANLYVQLTKSIPNYQETNPAVMAGLQLAIPALKSVNIQYDNLAKRTAELAKNPPKHEYDYFAEMAEFENMYIRFSEEFLGNFIPVIDAIEALSKDKKDQELISETRSAISAIKPTFQTKTD